MSEREEIAAEVDEVLQAGARARTKRTAERGIAKTKAGLQLSQIQKDAARYKAFTRLMWPRERILQETDWTLRQLMAIENFVQEEEIRLWGSQRPEYLFAEYREQQGLLIEELADVARIMSKTGQYQAMVSALKARSDILDRIIKTGQDLGVVPKRPQEVNVNSTTRNLSLSVQEVRFKLQEECGELRDLLEGEGKPKKVTGAASAVLRKITGEEEKKEASQSWESDRVSVDTSTSLRSTQASNPSIHTTGSS